MDVAALRAQFPVLARVAYLNAGTTGPVPRAATRATTDVLEGAERDGRAGPWFTAGAELATRLRAAYAALLGAPPDEVALTASTSDGIARVLAGLELRAGDEVLTSVGEHPGLLGPLGAAVAQRGIAVREVPLARIADEVGPRTALVACSHVHWATGEVAPAALASAGIPVLLDGAQGAGAVPVHVRELGCTFYAGSGQKWLCGPVGTGMLWLDPAWRERVVPRGPTFGNLAAPNDGLASPLQPDARRWDAPGAGAERCAGALAAHDVLAGVGWDAVHARAAELARGLARDLAAAGHEVLPRGDTTLVTWHDEDATTTRARLAEAGILVRDVPGRPWLRASVGAWNDASDLERLLDTLGRRSPTPRQRMSTTDELLRNNEAYAASFDKGELPPAPRRKLAVVACMDARLDPNAALGLEEGDAHVIRNAGGAVTDSEIRALAISQRVLGTEEIILIQHTGCGMRTFSDDEFKRAIQEETGVTPEWAAEAFSDLEDDVRRSMARIEASPFIPHRNVRGFVYEVETGRLREVA